jgi:hypothetical protein
MDFIGCPLSKSGIKKLSKIGSHLDTLLLHPLVGVTKGIELPGLIQSCVNLRRLEIGSENGGEALEDAFAEISQVLSLPFFPLTPVSLFLSPSPLPPVPPKNSFLILVLSIAEIWSVSTLEGGS